MIGPTGAVCVMVATKPVDFRKGAGSDVLACIAEQTCQKIDELLLSSWQDTLQQADQEAWDLYVVLACPREVVRFLS